MCMMVRDKTKKDTYMCATLINMLNRKELHDNHPQQRKANKWKNDARDGLIVTAIKHEDIDSVKVCEQLIDGRVILWLIDGLQRLSNFDKFKRGLFRLGKSIESPIVYYQQSVFDESGGVMVDEYGNPVMEDIEFDLRGKCYNDLPLELKEKFDNYQIDMVKHLDCTNEEIGYHIRRYNRQTSMNNNETSLTYMDEIGRKVKDISQSHYFFKDCGSYSSVEQNNGTCERVVCESLMAMFHMDNWQKNSKKLGAFLNQNASDEEFDVLKKELDRLGDEVGENYKNTFTSKDSFIWFTLFHRFALLGIDDVKFVEFLDAFHDRLHGEVLHGMSMSYDEINQNRATKDKKVIQKKLDILDALMKDFLHMEDDEFCNESNQSEETVGIEAFIAENVDIDPEAVHSDMEIYNDILDGLEENYILLDSKLREVKNRPSLLAMVAYSIKEDFDLDGWIERYGKENNMYLMNQKQNYLHMVTDYQAYQSALENKRQKEV